MGGVVEVTDVDGPDGDADEGDDLESEEENKFWFNNYFNFVEVLIRHIGVSIYKATRVVL